MRLKITFFPAFSRYAVDPYAVLALLGFMVFLFYIIYRQVDKMLTFDGNAPRQFPKQLWERETKLRRGNRNCDGGASQVP